MKPNVFQLCNTRRAALCSALALSGCASITGLDASSEYACKAPIGVKCDSVSGTYHNALQNNLPSQRPQRAPASTSAPATPAPIAARAATARTAASTGPQSASVATTDAPFAASAIRSHPRLLRLWIKPWEDADRDLHDQGYVYVQVDAGRWLIEHAQRQIRDAFAPVRPPRRPAAATTDDGRTAPRAASSAPGNATAPAIDAMKALQATTRSTPERETAD